MNAVGADRKRDIDAIVDHQRGTDLGADPTRHPGDANDVVDCRRLQANLENLRAARPDKRTGERFIVAIEHGVEAGPQSGANSMQRAKGRVRHDP